MPVSASAVSLEQNFDFVKNPNVEVWEELIRLVGEHEGWALSVHDYTVWLDGFGRDNFCLLVALEKESKKLVGSISSSTYVSVNGSKRLTTVGMFFVLPEYRGIGLGRELFSRLLSNPEIVEDNKGLTSVPNMADKYAKVFGFDKFTEWKLYAFTAKIEDLRPDKLEIPADIAFVSPATAGWDKVLQYDSKYMDGVDRNRYMKTWMTAPASYTKVALNRSGAIVGFGVVRETYDKRLSVEPLYADSDEIAGALLRVILESIPNLNEFHLLKICSPETSTGTFNMLNIVTDRKAKNAGHIFVQFTKELLQMPVATVYGIMESAQSVV